MWALLNQTKATNFTTHGRDISLLHTRYRVSDSSHSVLGKDGCYIVAKPHLIFTILRYQKEVNKPLSKKSFRSSHRSSSVKKLVLKNFVNFTEEHLCQILFFDKACNFIKKRLHHKSFSVKFVKCLRTTILKNTWKRLLLSFLNMQSQNTK